MSIVFPLNPPPRRDFTVCLFICSSFPFHGEHPDLRYLRSGCLSFSHVSSPLAEFKHSLLLFWEIEEITKTWGSCCSPDGNTNMTSRLSKNAQRRTIMSESPSWYGERESEKDSEGIWHPLCVPIFCMQYIRSVCVPWDSLARATSFISFVRAGARRRHVFCPRRTTVTAAPHPGLAMTVYMPGVCVFVVCIIFLCTVVPGLHSLAATHILFCVSGR